MKLSKDDWWVKLLGTPDHWCGLVWGAVWRLVVALVVSVVGWHILVIFFTGNWEILRYFAGAEVERGWIAVGVVADIVIVWVGGMFCLYNSRQIAKWMSEHCPKISYRD